jgi:alpha-amylase/alpha-mannosidase (GH57 family)
MEKSDTQRYLIIHGHFYQPPRENPWTGRIDRQVSAAPYHDWNEKITTECYKPNARSRRLDGFGRITRLVNNYEHISFNFGPTLLSWIEDHHPHLHRSIVEADVASARSRGGRGNAIAQVYNHIIMPLASMRDQETQIRWGVHDFRNRFDREPEGIWLAETAINETTLEILIDYGFRFIILSPDQAEKIRPLDRSAGWTDVSGGSIPTGMPYRCFGSRKRRSRKRGIDIFFYDAELSTDVSFNHLLRNGDSFAEAISSAYERTGGNLVTIATDGEIYGHHEPFADMALSYLIDVAAPARDITMTNFSAYLDSFKPQSEVRIKPGEGTAWSCSHGVGRWKSDCGCNTGAPDGWTQQWREPLRQGLDWLRDRLAGIFEAEGGRLLTDPWAARSDYIDIVGDRSEGAVRSFLEKHSIEGLGEEGMSRAISLLESQHNALLMFTSCGWFFNDISGIETTQLMKYAARAIELSGGRYPAELEEMLLEYLAGAASNIPTNGTGADLYEKEKKYSAVDAGFLAGQFVLTRQLECPGASPARFGYDFKVTGEVSRPVGDEEVRIGLVEILSPFTLERNVFGYFLVLGSPVRLICLLRELKSKGEFGEIKANFESLPEQKDRKEIIKSAAEHFGGHVFALSDLFPEDKEQLLGKIAARRMEKIFYRLEELYMESRDMLKLFGETSLEPPPSIRVPAETVLSSRLEEALEGWERTNDPAGLDDIRSVFNEARYYGVRLEKSHVSSMFTSFILERLEGIADGLDSSVTDSIIDLADYSDLVEIEIDPHRIQNMLYEILIGPASDAISRIEKMEPGSEKEIEGIKSLLRLAKRFNFDTDRYEQRIPL